jgi:hypothetical protein
MATNNLLKNIEDLDFMAFCANWKQIKHQLSEQEKQFLLTEIVFYHYSDKYFGFFVKILDKIIDSKISLNFNTDLWSPTFLSLAVDKASRKLFDYLIYKGAAINFVGDRLAFDTPGDTMLGMDALSQFATCLDFAELKLANSLTTSYNYSVPDTGENDKSWPDIDNKEEIAVKKQDYYYLVEQAQYLKELVHTNRLIEHIKSLSGKTYQLLSQEKKSLLLQLSKSKKPNAISSGFRYFDTIKYPVISEKEMSEALDNLVFTGIDTTPLTNTQYFADINMIFRGIGAVLLRFSVSDNIKFNQCIHWSAVIENSYAGVIMNSFLKQLLSNKTLSSNKTFRKLTEGFLTFKNTPIAENIDNIKIHTISPYAFDGELAQSVYGGGSHLDHLRSAEQTKKQSQKFTEQIMQYRFNAFKILGIYGAWSEWYCGLAWDYTYFIFDQEKGEFWILAIADTD